MTDKLIDLDSLKPLFQPDSIAVIGASSDPAKIGGRPVAYLKTHPYQGALYPVNPRTPEVQGLKSYARITEVEGPVDLAIFSVPERLVRPAMEDCAAKGVRAIVMFSSGFAEIGKAGRREQEAIGAIARDAGMRLLGPNCMGVVNFSTAMVASFHPAFAEVLEPGGRIGMVSQSGAFGGISYQLARDRDLAFSHILTTGNEADVDIADCLAFLTQDPATRVIMMYIEGCRDGPKLLEAMEMARAAAKPVVVIKLGRTQAGAAAAQSHTAALAGADAIYDALFRQYGAYRAHSIEEFFDIGAAAAVGALPRNDRVGIVTVSGGVGVLMADEAAARGLDVAAVPEATQAKIKDVVAFAATRNPIDVTGQVVNDIGLLHRMVELVLDEADFGAITCFQGSMGRSPIYEDTITETWLRLRRDYPETLLVIAGLCSPAFHKTMQQAGCLTFTEPTHALRAIAALDGFRRAALRHAPAPEVGPPPALPSGTIGEVAALAILREAGLPTVDERLVESGEDAAEAARALGFPVVLKVVAPDIVHKSDVGGVALNVASAADAAEAYAAILARVAQAAPDATVEGCLVAPMIGDGVETILGVQRDPIFGPVVMFGLGGVFVEVLQDVTFRVAPFGEAEAHRMIGEIKAYRVLEGVRGRPPADIDALARALSRLSLFAAAAGDRLETLDVNPFMVRARGAGAVALDAVMVTRD